jgi:hypothetical protein
MLADPQSITINAVANSLPRLSTGTNTSVYQKDDGTIKLTITHTYQKTKNRRLVKFEQKKISSDPLVTAQNAEYRQVAYIVMESPVTIGFTVAEQKDFVVGMADWLKASTNANTIAVIGGQS